MTSAVDSWQFSIPEATLARDFRTSTSKWGWRLATAN
jgi:hypothetical protein